MKRLSKSTKMRGAIFALLLAFAMSVSAQVQVRGTVVDERGEPAIGATVRVYGTTQGVMVDFNGNFTLSAPAGGTLLIHFMGYLDQTVPVSPNVGIIQLVPDMELLDEVVVIAYGLSRRYAITGAVSTISREDIAMRPVANVAAALEGMGPGVQVSTSFGEPGAAPRIRVRGFSSLLPGAGGFEGSHPNDPLIVLDGVTFNGSLSSINPDDIESISILKDAASAALFGSRAANGVILVTTRRGRAGEHGQVNISIRQGITQRATREYDRIGPHDFMQASWTALRNGLMTGGMSLANANAAANEGIMDVLMYNIFNVPNHLLFDANGVFNPNAQVLSSVVGDLDWFDAMQRTGHRQEYNISGMAATQRLNMFYSFGHLNETGFIRESDFQRFTGRVNAEYSPRRWLTAGVNVSASFEERNRNDVMTSGAMMNVFGWARNQAPIFPVHLHDLTTHPDGSRPGGFILDGLGRRQFDDGMKYSRPGDAGNHAIWQRQLNRHLTRLNRTEIAPFARINFMDNLNLTVRGSIVHRASILDRYDNAIVGDGRGAIGGRTFRDQMNWREQTFAQMLSWRRTFNDVHSVDVIAGHEYYEWFRMFTNVAMTSQAMPGNSDMNNFSVAGAITGARDTYRLQSVLSRVRYSFDDRYFFDLSFRRDGSSMFHPNYRWGNFWSVGGSWVVSHENFMRDIHWVNSLRARASYGQVGQDTFAHGNWYLYKALFRLQTYGGQPAATRSLAPDPTVTWESLDNFTAGIETRLFNRVNFVIDYFDKRNVDLLFDVLRPQSAGNVNDPGGGNWNPTTRQNLGVMSNRGFEISVDVDIVNSGDWRWNLGGDVTFMRNRIVRLPEEIRELGHISDPHRWFEGQDRFQFYLRQWAGVDQMTGLNLFYLDPDLRAATVAADRLVVINGVEYTTQAAHGVRRFSGSAIPDAFGAIRSHVQFRNFSLSTLFTYSIGGYMVDSSYNQLMTFGTGPTAMHVDILNAWSGVPAGMTENSPNRIDPNGVPRKDNAIAFNRIANTTQNLTSASFFSIKNISLGYTFPRSVTDRLDLSGLNMSLNAENIAIFTQRRGMDPSQSDGGTTANTFVPARTISLGLNITL